MIACDFTRAPRELLCGVLLLVPPPPPLGFLHPPTHPCVLCEALSDLSCRSPGALVLRVLVLGQGKGGVCALSCSCPGPAGFPRMLYSIRLTFVTPHYLSSLPE